MNAWEMIRQGKLFKTANKFWFLRAISQGITVKFAICFDKSIANRWV